MLVGGLGIGLTAGLTQKNEIYKEPVFPEFTGEEMDAILNWLNEWMSQHEDETLPFPIPESPTQEEMKEILEWLNEWISQQEGEPVSMRLPESPDQSSDFLSTQSLHDLTEFPSQFWVMIAFSAVVILGGLAMSAYCYHQQNQRNHRGARNK